MRSEGEKDEGRTSSSFTIGCKRHYTEFRIVLQYIDALKNSPENLCMLFSQFPLTVS